uniref:HMG box domain-containing protein n=1 Tax=viral metagenome TaxID=1070528 RepID=A0A6C0E8L6_9ZZZZ
MTKTDYDRRFKSDQILVDHFSEFINFLFPNDKPCDLLNPKSSKSQFVQLFAGVEHTSLDSFKSSLKNSKKRLEKKSTQESFLQANNLTRPPRSAMDIFCKDENKRNEYQKNNPNLKPGEVRDLMIADWGKLNEKNRKQWETKYDYLRNEFFDKVRKIDETKLQLFDKSFKKKKPSSPYILYMKEQMKIMRNKDPNLGVTELTKIIGPMWKSLSDDEKDKYKLLASNATDVTSENTSENTSSKPKASSSTDKPKAKASASSSSDAKSTDKPADKKSTSKASTKTEAKDEANNKKATSKPSTSNTGKKSTKKSEPEPEPEPEKVDKENVDDDVVDDDAVVAELMKDFQHEDDNTVSQSDDDLSNDDASCDDE